MGKTIEKSAAFKNGLFYFVTDKNFYRPGETVTGLIKIRCTKQMELKNILIEAKGRETVKYTGTSKDILANDVYHKSRIMDKNEVVFTSKGPLTPGDYTVPFSFKLPAKCSNSFNYMEDQSMLKKIKLARSHAEVKYTLKAIMDTNDFGLVEFKEQVPVIKDQQKGKKNFSQTIKLSNFAGKNHGTTRFDIDNKKSVFTPTEQMQTTITIDNQDSGIDVEKLEIALYQHVRLSKPGNSIKGLDREFTNLIGQKKTYQTKVPKKSTRLETFDFTNDLRAVRYPVDKFRYKNSISAADSERVFITAEEKYFQERLPPTENSEFTKINYYIEIIPIHGTLFKGKQVKTEFPIIIASDEKETQHMITDPKNWYGYDLTKAPEPVQEDSEPSFEEPEPVEQVVRQPRKPVEDYDTDDELEQIPPHLRDKVAQLIDHNVEKRVKDYIDQFRTEVYEELEDHRVVNQEQIDANIYGGHASYPVTRDYLPPAGYGKRYGTSRSPVRQQRNTYSREVDYDQLSSAERNKFGTYTTPADRVYEKTNYDATDAAKQRLRAKNTSYSGQKKTAYPEEPVINGRKYIDSPNRSSPYRNAKKY